MQKTPPYGKSWRPKVKTLWRDVHKNFDLETDGTEILRVACDSLENFYHAQDQLETEGLTFTTASGQIRKHPLIEIMKNERAGFLAALRSLNLDWEPEPRKPLGRPGREPGL